VAAVAAAVNVAEGQKNIRQKRDGKKVKWRWRRGKSKSWQQRKYQHRDIEAGMGSIAWRRCALRGRVSAYHGVANGEIGNGIADGGANQSAALARIRWRMAYQSMASDA